MTVYTVGHSTLPVEDFVALLRHHGIAAVADVRRYPASRRHPHFARDALAATLANAGIAYVWLPELGGRRRGGRDSPHVGWRSASFRAYADHMETEEFARGIARLLALAAERPTAVLCAEVVPWRCHRQLVADALLAAGHTVRHIVDREPPAAHRLTPFARRAGDRLVYDAAQPALPLAPGGRRAPHRP